MDRMKLLKTKKVSDIKVNRTCSVLLQKEYLYTDLIHFRSNDKSPFAARIFNIKM